ncbi:hypothetical protein GS539_19290 [Rhodococcus hoagii]|nr:hypothetical protein [Prescottella equi]
MKRTPMKRTPMKSGQSKRKRDAAAALAKAAPIAVARAEGRCERCGSYVETVLHHRLRRMSADRERPSNYLMLCPPCHNMSDQAVHANPVVAKRGGWILESLQEPSEVPVIRFGRWVLLTDAGDVIDVESP